MQLSNLMCKRKYTCALFLILILATGNSVRSTIGSVEVTGDSHKIQEKLIWSEASFASIPFVDEHYGYADGIIDPKEYAYNYTDSSTGITAYFEHNGTILFIGLSAVTSGWIGCGWKNYTDTFDNSGLNRSDLIYGYAPSTTLVSYSRISSTDFATVHYVVTLRNGTLIEEGNYPDDASTTSIEELPALQQYKNEILGMRIGEVRHFIIPAEFAFNQPDHPLYSEDLEYVITLNRINDNFDNPTDVSQIVYSDRHSNDTLQSFPDTDQTRIVVANASDDGTTTQVEYFIKMDSNDINDIQLFNSTDTEFPFVFMHQITEDFNDIPTQHSDWASPLVVMLPQNTAPNLNVENPQDDGEIEGIVTIQVNITDNTFVRSAHYQVDDEEWRLLRRNFQTGLWESSFNTTSYDLGSYELSFQTTDPSNVTSSYYMSITIVDHTEPYLDSPQDIEIIGAPSGQNITWHPSDIRPDSYEILMNGSQIESGEWNGSIIIVDLNHLDQGFYNFTVLVNDTVGNLAIDSVLVTVSFGTLSPFEIENYLPLIGVVVAAGFFAYAGIFVYKSRRQRSKYATWETQ
ncbi:MAG: FKBP-type peptidyl-prolyl cis-trans isomerase [Candidatus Thorarchaeota archaeon]